MPPDGDVFGLSVMRSFPPPPESSSSSPDQVDEPSDRRNIRKRAPPRMSATRWRAPKITRSSVSRDIAERDTPQAPVTTRQFATIVDRSPRLSSPARGGLNDHGRLFLIAFSHRARP